MLRFCGERGAVRQTMTSVTLHGGERGAARRAATSVTPRGGNAMLRLHGSDVDFAVQRRHFLHGSDVGLAVQRRLFLLGLRSLLGCRNSVTHWH